MGIISPEPEQDRATIPHASPSVPPGATAQGANASHSRPVSEAKTPEQNRTNETKAGVPPDKTPAVTSTMTPGRQHVRRPIECEVGFETQTHFFAGFAQNVSIGGIFVASFDILPIGTEVEVSFSLPDGNAITAHAVVRWVRMFNNESPEIWPGMGLSFQNLSSQAGAAIARFLEQREPLFFPEDD